MVYSSLTDMLLVGTGASFTSLNLYYPERGTTTTKAISGSSKFIQLASGLLNFDILSGGWKLDDMAERLLRLKEYTPLGTLREVAAEQLPASALRAIEQLSGVRALYGRGIWSKGESIGYTIAFYRTDQAVQEELDRLSTIAGCIDRIVPELMENEIRNREKRLIEEHTEEGDYLEAQDPQPAEVFRPDIYLGLDRELKIVFANHAASQLGEDRRSILGRRFEEFLAPGERSSAVEMLQRLAALSGEASRSMTIGVKEDLRLRMVAYRNEKNEKNEIISLILRDISKEHRLSAAFLQRERMLQQLADAMSEAVWIESIEPQKIIYINPRFTNLFHLGSENTEEEIAALFDTAEQAQERSLETRRPTQIERRLAGEPERWVRIRSYPILNPDTQPLLINIAEDITQERRAHQLLEKQYESSRFLLHEMNHRIKNNLTIVAGLTGLAAGRSSDPDVQQEFELLENKISSIALVHEILFHGEEGDQLDFAYYCENLLKILTPATPQGSPIRIETELKSHPISPSAAGVLGLVITELVTNASKHAFPESVDDPVIRVNFTALTQSDDAGMMLTVSDNGLPLGEDPLSSRGGTLGMEILKTLTEQIGGRITFTQGKAEKTFSIYLPLSAG